MRGGAGDDVDQPALLVGAERRDQILLPVVEKTVRARQNRARYISATR